MSAISFTARPMVLSLHMDEMQKEASSILNRQIKSAIDTQMGILNGDEASITGDTGAEGIIAHIEISLNEDNVFLNEESLSQSVEKTVLSTLEFGYTNAIQDASQIVQSRHPEDSIKK